MTRKIAFLAATLALAASAYPAHAQSGDLHRIGFLSMGSLELNEPWLAAFRQGLRELGYFEGRNTVIEQRFAVGKASRLPALASELVRLKVDVFVIHGTKAILTAKEASATIPIVFTVAADPVGSGIVASLAQPGGNVTGLSDLHSDLVAKRLELLKEVVPAASRIAVIWNPTNPAGAGQLKTLKDVAPSMGVTIVPVAFGNPGELAPAFAALRQMRPDALNVLGYPLVGAYRKEIAAFALEHHLPTISTFERFTEAGGLMTYGADFSDLYRRAATYVDKILKGSKPADLPVEQPTKFRLVLNVKTARPLGITFPPSILLRADEVIE